mmetsp:Transcript_25887/g.31410  ORF Transcript_25887/g.31410 Transcript_25887/m.31410 type:complete len:217 (-) Transcript_25887:56-706(-)
MESRLVEQNRSMASCARSGGRSFNCEIALPSISLARIWRSSMRSSSLWRMLLGRSANAGPEPGGSDSILRTIPMRKPLLLEMRAMFASQNLSSTACASASFNSFSVDMHLSSKSCSLTSPFKNIGSKRVAKSLGNPRSGTLYRGGERDRRPYPPRGGERESRLRGGERESRLRGERLRSRVALSRLRLLLRGGGLLLRGGLLLLDLRGEADILVEC